MASYIDRGNNKYEIRISLGYDAKGRQIRKTKNITAKTKRELKLAISQFESYIYSSDYKEITDMRFTDFVERWKANYANRELKANTRDKYFLMLDISIVPYFERKRISKITTLNLLDYFREEEANGIGPSALEARHRVIRSLFKYATEWGIIDKDISLNVKKPRIKKREKNFYTAKQIQLLLEKTKDLQLYQQLIIKLAVTCGMRRGEILGLAVNDLNYNDNTIKVRRAVINSQSNGLEITDTKNEKDRTIPAPAWLMEELQEMAKEKQRHKAILQGGWIGATDINGENLTLLFSHAQGNAYTPSSVTRMFSRFLKEHDDLPKISFHDLRHSAASYLLQQGINVKVIQKILGHSDIKVTLNTYAHVSEEGYKEAANAFEKLVELKQKGVD